MHVDGLTGCHKLGKSDHIIIFFTQNVKNIDMSCIADHGEAELKMMEVVVGKQSTDMHIGSYLGYLVGMHGKNCKVIIISKDLGYDNIIKFWREKVGVTVSRSVQIDDSKSKEASGAKQQQKQAVEEKKSINDEIQQILSKAGLANDIIVYVLSIVKKNVNEKNGKQQIYRSIVSKYGQDKGLNIYNHIKKSV